NSNTLVFLVTGGEVKQRQVKYYKDEEASKNLIREEKDGKKWFHTGDMAYKDNENKPEPDTETNKLDEVALFKRLIEYARERYVDVPITSSKPDIKNKDETPSVQETPVDYQELMIIDDLTVQKEYQLALNRLLTLDNKNPLVKRLLMVCHYFLDNDDDFIALIGVPDTVTEFAYLGDVLERSGKSSELREIIDLLDSHETISISEPYKRLKKKIGGMYNGTD
ncbi:hypothetical protein LCGC14_2648790, partial [marine sediment metagenome]